VIVRHALPAAALVVVGVLSTTIGPTSDIRVNDFFVYQTFAEGLRAGLFPYRDFPLEYPPLALAPIWLASAFGSEPGRYALVFGLEMLACGLAAQLIASKLAGSRATTVAWLLAFSPLVTGAMVRTHFDLLPVALTLGALLALSRGRTTSGFVLLGVGAMTKLFPAILVPVAAAWLIGRGERRQAAIGVAAFAATTIAISLPFLGDGYLDIARFHAERPVQIESTPASILFALGDSEVTGAPARPDRFKSSGLDGGATSELQWAFAALQLLALAAVCAVAARSQTAGEGEEVENDDASRPATPLERQQLVLAAATALTAFVALGKVLSPQFMIWLLPFGALAWAYRERAAALLIGAATGLTQLEFPARYFDLVGGDTPTIVLVAARNALLLAALTTLLWRVAAPARWRRRVAAASP